LAEHLLNWDGQSELYTWSYLVISLVIWSCNGYWYTCTCRM